MRPSQSSAQSTEQADSTPTWSPPVPRPPRPPLHLSPIRAVSLTDMTDVEAPLEQDAFVQQEASIHSMTGSEDSHNKARSPHSPRMLEQHFNLRRKAAISEALRPNLAKRAQEARVLLGPLAETPSPPSSRCAEIRNFYSSMLSLTRFRTLLHKKAQCSPFMDKVVARVLELGGPAEVRFLLSVAKIDLGGTGDVDVLELQLYESEGEEYLQGVRTICDNAAVVSTLMLGLTHLVTIGRPVPFQLATPTTTSSRNAWTDTSYLSPDVLNALVWSAYAFNVLAELSALGTLVIAFSARSMLLTVLPTLEAKVEWVGQIRPILIITRGINVLFFFFSISIALCALVASSTFAWLAVGLLIVVQQIVTSTRAHMLHNAIMLLHEEVRQTLNHQPVAHNAPHHTLSSSGMNSYRQPARTAAPDPRHHYTSWVVTPNYRHRHAHHGYGQDHRADSNNGILPMSQLASSDTMLAPTM